MKKLLSLLSLFVLLVIAIQSCKKEAQPASKKEISQDVLTQIRVLGFSDENVITEEGGYIVEGDIFIPSSMLTQKANWSTLNVANSEQYRTTNLVTGSRTITVSVSSTLPSSAVAATDVAISRYNAQNLRITFQRVTSNGNIQVTKTGSPQYLASSGFPTSTGNPYGNVTVSTYYLTRYPGNNLWGSIMAHELGHCIGFRHTDYMDRNYSCGGSHVNEGDGGVGAINIPGTPTGPDANSWMLSCIGVNDNRPFNSNDVKALNYLYSK